MTPAIKQLQKHHIAHTLHAYEHDASSDQSYGAEAAAALGLPPSQVFKTLVIEDSNADLAVAIVPVSGTLNLKSLASSLRLKKVSMADKSRVSAVTGYVLGGVSPLGQKKTLRTVIDESAFEHSVIYVSAGKRGLDVALSPTDLLMVCKAKQAPIANPDS